MPVPPSASPPIGRRLMRDDAHDAIRDAILDGTFAPGEILDDAQLTQWLGISRTPIRDALMTLQLEGLVEIHAQSRTRVAKPSPEQVEESLQTTGAVMGGVMRITIPVLIEERRTHLMRLVDIAVAAAEATDVEAHMTVALQVYDALLDDCPNTSLTRLARWSLLQLTFQYRSVIEVRTPNWKLCAPSANLNCPRKFPWSRAAAAGGYW